MVCTVPVEALASPGLAIVLQEASNRALSGGTTAMGAEVLGVVSLLWMRTVNNYQCRYGGSLANVTRQLVAEGGIRRLYRGLAPALLQSPLARFGDMAANDGVLAALAHTSMPFSAKMACASSVAAAFRACIMPIDACQTTLQVDGREGFKKLIERTRANPVTPWRGTTGAMSSTCIGHFTWFYTNNQLQECLPKFDTFTGKHLRQALIGFMSSVVADVSCNPFRVLKVVRQTSPKQITYPEAAAEILAADGLSGLLGRGLKSRILASGLQGALFTVCWRAISEQRETM